MICRNCRSDIGTKEWKYCPFCGESILRKPMHQMGMQDVADKMLYGLQKRLMRKLLATLASGFAREQKSPVRGFSVKVISGRGPAAQGAGQAVSTRRKTDIDMTKKRPTPKETLEPETSITELPGKLRADICVPGVEHLDDIDVLEFENSCEVRAYSGSKLYFKIIQIPKDLNLSGKSLSGKTLVLEFMR
ncbi:MAG: hypothetical protein U9Q92_00705 [archaeon]|nr:hypothetical protein [archaeon]